MEFSGCTHRLGFWVDNVDGCGAPEEMEYFSSGTWVTVGSDLSHRMIGIHTYSHTHDVFSPW